MATINEWKFNDFKASLSHSCSMYLSDNKSRPYNKHFEHAYCFHSKQNMFQVSIFIPPQIYRGLTNKDDITCISFLHYVDVTLFPNLLIFNCFQKSVNSSRICIRYQIRSAAIFNYN